MCYNTKIESFKIRFAEKSDLSLILSFIKDLAEYENFSTFIGKAGLYLEDLYIKPEMRGKGLGKEMLSFLAKTAKDRDYKRLEWWCLDWNKPSIKFYESIGAQAMKDWTVYRLSGDDLNNLAKNNN